MSGSLKGVISSKAAVSVPDMLQRKLRAYYYSVRSSVERAVINVTVL